MDYEKKAEENLAKDEIVKAEAMIDKKSDSGISFTDMLQKAIKTGTIEQKVDPLVFNDLDRKKATRLSKAIDAVQAKNHVFYPLILTDPERLYGHA